MKRLMILLFGLVFFTGTGTAVILTRIPNPRVGHYVGAYSLSALFFVLVLIEVKQMGKRKSHPNHTSEDIVAKRAESSR